MKKKITVVILAMAIVFLMTPAMALETLSAGIDGNCLNVYWDVECTGTAVLTVYKGGWPVTVRNVECEAGMAKVYLDNPAGDYSIRLRTGKACLTAGVTVAGNTPEPETTLRPVLTPGPEVTPSAKPTSTPVVTQRPQATQTPGPTVNVTMRPVVQQGNMSESLAAQVVAQVNAERAKYGLSQLRVDSELTRAAQVRAKEIVEKFSHTRPDGSKWSTVSASAYGENIAKGQKTADKVMAAWLTSAGHRANILKASFGSIGVCAYVSNGITYWVQLFGK